MLDPREKARRDKEKELAADLNNAADLLGATALGGTYPSSFQVSDDHLSYSCLVSLTIHPFIHMDWDPHPPSRHGLEGARLAYLRATTHQGGLCRILR